MRRVATIFLRCAITAIVLVVLAVCVFALPAMWVAAIKEIPEKVHVLYFIIAGFYLAAVPFLYALRQAWKILNNIDNGRAFSLESSQSLRRISYCAAAVSVVFAATSPLFYIWADHADAPGLMIISLFLIVAPFTIAIFVAVLERLFREAMDLKSEVDLTV